jgi:hypothetical protein
MATRETKETHGWNKYKQIGNTNKGESRKPNETHCKTKQDQVIPKNKKTR